MTTYEQPFNKRFRHFLQLEHYLKLIDATINEPKITTNIITIQSLVHILDILDRNPIQSELIYEIQAKQFVILYSAKNIQRNNNLSI